MQYGSGTLSLARHSRFCSKPTKRRQRELELRNCGICQGGKKLRDKKPKKQTKMTVNQRRRKSSRESADQDSIQDTRINPRYFSVFEFDAVVLVNRLLRPQVIVAIVIRLYCTYTIKFPIFLYTWYNYHLKMTKLVNFLLSKKKILYPFRYYYSTKTGLVKEPLEKGFPSTKLLELPFSLQFEHTRI